MTGVGSISMTGDLTIISGNTDKYITFDTVISEHTHSWRIGYIGSGAYNANYFVLQSTKNTSNTWTSALTITNETLESTFAASVTAPTFKGNLDGTYINKLTNYSKATAIGSIATTDSLNTALGKLEFKTDFIYNDLFGTDNDDVINKWHEIVDFIDSVKEGTDITDEFVTRKTDQTITGAKTFSTQQKFIVADGTAPFTVTSKTVVTNLNADLLDGYHAGVKNGQVAIYVPFPGFNTLVNLGYNTEANATNNEEYLKGICKWAIDHYEGNGNCTLIGVGSPNSSGTLILHLYSNNGKDSTTGLPRYCEGVFFHTPGNARTFGTNNYVWQWSHSTWYGNALTANKWITARTLTIGNTGKSVDGSANVSWSLAEIGASDATHTHSVKINGATKTIAASGGTTVDLGSYLPLTGGTLSGGINFSNTSHLLWNSGSYHQRIFLTDDSTSDTAVFTFQQSTDSGTNWSDLMTIKDNGKVIANTFVGTLSGNASSATKLTSSAGSASLPIYFSDGKPVACTPSSLFSNLSNYGNNLSITVAGQNRTLTVNYANSADRSNYLTSRYVGNKGDTVAQVKQKILDSFTSLINKQGYSIQVASQFIQNYPNDDYVISSGGIYSLTYLTPGYDGKSYGQWLAACLGSNRLYIIGRSGNQWEERKTIAWTSDIPTALKNPYTLTFSAGTFAAKTYDGSSAVTVNIPTHTSHLVNNSGFLTQHQSLDNYVTLNTAQTITNCKIFKINAPVDDRETVYYNIGLKLSSYGDNHKKVAAIGMGNEPQNQWYKAAIGFERTDTHDRGDIVLLFNNRSDRTTCVYSDIKVRINANGNINTLGSISASGFIKTNSSDSYILLGGGGHKELSSITASKLNSITIVSAKEFSLSNAAWTDTGYTFANLDTGTYAVQVTFGTTLVASGIMSVYKNLSDTAGDEIPLHVYGTAGWRPYLRTYANKLQISSNDTTNTARTVTIKIAQIL